MRAIDVVRVLLGAVLALALLPAVAGAGLLGDAGPPDGVQRQAGADLEYRAPRFWLPDSMETSWLASDKKLHFLACYSIVLTGDAATDGLDTGVVWAAGLSAAKELWDLWFKTPASRRGVSRGDLVADAAGVIAAIIAIEAFGD